jgi:hypothetical protein
MHGSEKETFSASVLAEEAAAGAGAGAAARAGAAAEEGTGSDRTAKTDVTTCEEGICKSTVTGACAGYMHKYREKGRRVRRGEPEVIRISISTSAESKCGE